MSLSVDDLVSSFSSSHIGQEAIDLAALQAQLAQTLFASATQIPSRNSHTCNTPVARTPSSSFSFSRPTDEVTMDDAERMVEEPYMPSSSAFPPQPTLPAGSQAHLSPYLPLSVEPSPSSASVFTSTDPFYLAIIQQQQQQPASTSFFAKNGHITQNSPFFARQAAAQQQHRDSHNHSLTVDTSHSIFVSAAY